MKLEVNKTAKNNNMVLFCLNTVRLNYGWAASLHGLILIS